MTKGQIVSLATEYVLFQLGPKGYDRYVPYVARLLYLQNKGDDNYTSKIIERTHHSHEELLEDARLYIRDIHLVVNNIIENVDETKLYGIYNEEDSLKEILKSITNEMEEKYNDDIFLSQSS